MAQVPKGGRATATGESAGHRTQGNLLGWLETRLPRITLNYLSDFNN